MKKEQRILNALIKDLKEGNFKYKPKDETPIDWSSYNLAKIKEIKLVLLFIKNAVDEVAPEERVRKGRGRKRRVTAAELAKAILAQQYFQKADRTTSGLIDLFKPQLGIRHDISPSTLDRAYHDRRVREIIKRVFKATSDPIAPLEKSFSIDTTGQSLSIKQNYANDRDDVNKHAGYDKIAVMVSNNFHIATSAVLGPGTMNDSPTFAPLLCETTEKFLIDDVEADAGFLSRENCSLVGKLGGIPYIYPKQRITLNWKGSKEWHDMLKEIIKDPQKWLEHYHKRSNNECYFSSYKRRFTTPLLRKLPFGRNTECLARLAVQNICMLINAYYEQDIEVENFQDREL
jgi:transposase